MFVKRLKLIGRLTSLPARQAGDTIVEVIISMTILGLVLTTAYLTTSHSLQVGTDAANRNQAIANAQKQIEIIKDSVSNSALYSGYTSQAGAFCIKDDGSIAAVHTGMEANTGYCDANTAGLSNLGQYLEAITFNNGDNVFTITVKWPGSSGQKQQLVVNYRAIGLYQALIVTTTAPPTNITGDSSSTYQATLGGTVNPGGTTITGCYFEQANSGSLDTSNWSGSPGYKIANCTQSNASISGDNTSHPVSATIGGVSPGVGQSYRLCARNALGNICANLQSWTPPNTPPPAVNLCTAGSCPAPPAAASPTSTTVNAGVNVTLAWNSINSASCSASSPAGWTGSIAVSGSQTFAAPASAGTYTYTMTCTGSGVNASASVTVIVNVPPPAPIINYFYASPSSICYGCSTTLYWGSTNTTSCSPWGPTTGSVGTGALYSSTSYSLTCSGAGGSTSSSTTVSVDPPPPPPPPAPTINYWAWNGGNSFSYNVSSANYCEVHTDNPSGGVQPFTPSLSGTYGVSAGNGGGGVLYCWDWGVGPTVSGHAP